MLNSAIEIGISVLLIGFALFALHTKQLIKSVLFLSALSMVSVLAYVVMRAPDVAVTEAVIGSGLVTSLFVFTLLSMKKVKQQ